MGQVTAEAVATVTRVANAKVVTIAAANNPKTWTNIRTRRCSLQKC